MSDKNEKRIVLVGGVRTPIGNFDFGGALKDVPADKLLAICFKETLKRTNLPPEKLKKEIVDKIDDVIAGNVCLPADAPNIARVAALKAGLPMHITGFSVQRNCASGIQSISSAVQAIKAGDGEIFLAGGTENMSQIPKILKDARWGKKLGDSNLIDALWLGLTDPITKEIMGLTAENVAAKYGITREEQDKFAVWSHRKAHEAQTKGRFKDQIVKVTDEKKNALGMPKIDIIAEDKCINPEIDEQRASFYPTVFKENGTVTPANACPISDGAASILVMAEDKAKELGITPEARVVSYAYAALDPSFMGEGPIYAVPKALAKAGLKIEDIDFFEINEAFAAQCIPCQRVLEIPDEKLNVWGGAIALGHPVGATGMILTVKMIYILKHFMAKYGVITMCVGGGQGGALVIENYQGGKNE